jgi:acetylornithine/succinyldiaminopimelate/putrescine aminotransferase
MEELDVPVLAEARGRYLAKKLAELPGVSSVRGLGLLLAAELVEGRAGKVATECLDRGLVLNAVTATALRMEPPLLVSEAEIDEGVAILAGALEAFAGEESV